MINVPNILLIGAAGRNVGKTTLACEIIKRIAKTQSVIGVKVTTVTESGLQTGCPRGNDTCGACRSFTDNYCISEETEFGNGKDTMRMLSAGASGVYWLRVKKQSLEIGLQALLEKIPQNTATICESNSLRHVFHPGVFVIVKNKDNNIIKKSCKEVLNLADILISSEGTAESLHAEQFTFADGKWSISQELI